MRKFAYAALAPLAALALASCGSTEDASEDAEAENVEISADGPMAGVDEPVEDPDAATDDTAATEDAIAAGEAAADAAADVQAAASEDAAAQ